MLDFGTTTSGIALLKCVSNISLSSFAGITNFGQEHVSSSIFLHTKLFLYFSVFSLNLSVFFSEKKNKNINHVELAKNMPSRNSPCCDVLLLPEPAHWTEIVLSPFDRKMDPRFIVSLLQTPPHARLAAELLTHGVQPLSKAGARIAVLFSFWQKSILRPQNPYACLKYTLNNKTRYNTPWNCQYRILNILRAVFTVVFDI